MVTADALKPDAAAIAQFLRMVVQPGDTFEIRALGVRQRYGKPGQFSGYFQHAGIDNAVMAVCALDGSLPAGCYLTINPALDALRARRNGRIERADTGETTHDHEIVRRTTLLIDADPDRPSGICATDEEHDAALDRVQQIQADLSAAGWPDPLGVDSGNGGQLWYRIDLPADDGGLVQRALAALGARYDDARVHVDQTVFNPARIGRIAGTINRKGDNIPERPHRMAQVMFMPDQFVPVPIELLEALAGPGAAPAKSKPAAAAAADKPVQAAADQGAAVRKNLFGWTREAFDKLIADHLQDCGPGETATYKSGIRVKLKTCPFDPAHVDSAALFYTEDRGPGFRCQHNSCAGRKWRQLLKQLKVAPPDADVAAEDGRPIIYLPGGTQPISATAGDLGNLLGDTRKFFVRGGAVVRLENDRDGMPMLRDVKPATLASDFESVAALVKVNSSGQVVSAVCNESAAKLIGSAVAFRDSLPPINVLARCPVLIERDGALVTVCGYDRESGTMAGGPAADEDLTLDEARDLLNELVRDFRFPSDADRARALAAFITPALVLGGLLRARAPIDLAEADASQSGKGFRMRLKSAVYNETVRNITQKRDGGVGGLEESFNAALIAGACFVNLDNVRGKIDSPAIESFITEDTYTARAAYTQNFQIDTRRVCLMMTSNRADLTTDLANRCACVRILKQPDGYEFKRYPEGDILDHARRNQSRFLGAIFAVVRAWHAAGRPRTNETRHDFRAWAQTLDWIARNLLNAGPLLDGHRETQQRMTNPVLNWLRDVALEVVREHRDGQWLRASDLMDVLSESPVELPGLPEHGDLADEETRKAALQGLGRKLGHCFRAGDEVTVDHLTVKRRETYDDGNRYKVREYIFDAAIAGQPIAAESVSIAAEPAEPFQDELEIPF